MNAFYTVFVDGKVQEIVKGGAEAAALVRSLRRAEHQAASKRFAAQLDAEEFAMWWNIRKNVNDDR